MAHEFEGYLRENSKEESEKPQYKKLPTDDKLPEGIYRPNLDIYNRSFHRFLVFYLVTTLIIFSIVGIYFLVIINEGKFQSIITTNVDPEFNATVNNMYNLTNTNEVVNNFKTNNTFIFHFNFENTSIT